MRIVAAEMSLPCADLAPCLEFFTERLGFRIETIFPAEAPSVASLSGHGLRLRLAPGGGDPGLIRLACDGLATADARVLVAPNGTRIELVERDPPIGEPPLVADFVVTRAGAGPAPGAGRAGMIYRDLIPGRLGGRYIASHIALPQGGPVADWVHFHRIVFQLIVCRKGWARLVYEDQGEPLVMGEGDLVLQPPGIRHRVLESSAGFEVVEIGCPALHETRADHDMALPTGRRLPARDFGGQVFLHHVAAAAPWRPAEAGFERRDTGLAGASGGLVDAWVTRPRAATAFHAEGRPDDLMFGFVLGGHACLDHDGAHPLGPADAFVIPPLEPWSLRDCSGDFRLLRVVAPAPPSG